MKRSPIRWVRAVGGACLFAALLALTGRAEAFVFSFTNAANPDRVTHARGYTGGNNQQLTISVGIKTGTSHATEMEVSVQNVIATWNALLPTTNNIQFQNGVVPNDRFDFESVLLHEVGHTLGLSHPNLGNLVGPPNVRESRFTMSEPASGGNLTFDDGPDNVPGSRDDNRGSDVNLNWFRRSNNNPFTIGSVVDKTTYSRTLNNLPSGDTYSAASTREVAASLGLGTDANESALTQGTFNGEAKRTLSHDDVAGLRYAMTGVDETAGNADDYSFTLTYAGITSSADILVEFTSSAGFAFASFGGVQTSLGSSTHFSITDANIFFQENPVGGLSWFFNQVSTVPEPGSLALMGLAATGGVGVYLRRRRAA